MRVYKQKLIDTHPREPTKWDRLSDDPDKLLRMIVDHVSEGRGLNHFVKKHGVNYSTLWYWLDSTDKRRDAYQNALLAGATYLVEQSNEILMAEPKFLDNGCTDAAWVNLMRARADQLKWQASKMYPSRFGDRQLVEMTAPGISVVGALQEARQRLVFNDALSPVMQALNAPEYPRSPTDI
jgi:hypothetical protein